MNAQNIFYKSIKTPNTIFQYALGVALIAALILIIPLIAKLFFDGMDWSVFDFFAAFILLFGAGFTLRIAVRKLSNNSQRAAVGLAIVTALFLMWSNLAVGIIGSEDNPANWMYVGVLAIGFLGAIIARLKPKGMTLVMFALAFSHLIITVIALVYRIHIAPESPTVEIISVNGFFAVLWIGSGLLFRNSARTES